MKKILINLILLTLLVGCYSGCHTYTKGGWPTLFYNGSDQQAEKIGEDIMKTNNAAQPK